MVRELRLDKRQTDLMVQKFKEADQAINDCQMIIDRCLRNCDKSEVELRDVCKMIRKDPKAAVKVCRKMKLEAEVLFNIEKTIKNQKQNIRQIETEINMNAKIPWKNAHPGAGG